jgi:hypothetical protein
MFGFDVFFEQELWATHIDDKNANVRDTRIYDFCWLMRCAAPGPAAIAERGCTFDVLVRGRTIHARAYQHPHTLAICIGAQQESPKKPSAFDAASGQPERGRAAKPRTEAPRPKNHPQRGIRRRRM